MFGRFLIAGASNIIFNADFSPFAVGPKSASSILTDTSLAFTRSTASTVQTSSSTINNTPAINDGCIGSINGTVKGLVIQPNTRNQLTTTQPRDLNSWNTGSGATITTNFAAGPDGQVLADRANVASGGFGPYSTNGTASEQCYTSWQRSVTTSTMQMAENNGSENVSPAICFNTGANTTWARLKLNNNGVSLQNFTAIETRTTTAVGGTITQARDVIVDYQQYELGSYPTEVIGTGNVARGNDRLYAAYGGNLIDSGKVRFYAKFYPKHASTQTVYYDSGFFGGAVSAQFLWSFGGAANINYAKIDNSSKKLVVRLNNGTAITSTNTVSWSQYDQVEINIEVGSNSTSIARYALNGGAWVNLILANIVDVPICTGTFSFFFNEAITTLTQDTGQLPCWLSQIKMYGKVSPIPTITSISTRLAPTVGGGSITINGFNFDSAITGTIDGNSISAVYVSGSQITGTIPSGTFGVKDILLTNGSGKNSGSSSVGLFNYYQQSKFNTLTPGSMTSAALVSATGIAGFTRAETTTVSSMATVQTSASTLESGVALNKPRIFSDGTITGLLIEQRMANFGPVGGARKINVGWNASAQGTQTNNVATGPDGAAASASQCNISSVNNISNYWQLTGTDTALRYTLSSWQRSVNAGTNGDMCQAIYNAANTVGAPAAKAGTNTWGRLVSSKQAVPMQYIFPVDTYDTSSSGGQTARARNVYVDFIHLEPGDWPTSAINDTGAVGAIVARPSDYLTWTAATASNRLRIYLRCYPIFATSTSIQATNAASNSTIIGSKAHIYYIDANNYMYMKDSDKKLYCKVAGSSETASTNAISFTTGNDLEILWETGNNIASILKYRVNAGSWIDLVMTTFSGDATPSTNLTVCNSTTAANSDGEALACVLRELRSYPIDVAVTDL